MKLELEAVHFRDLKVLVPEIFKDDRGFFLEAFRSDHYARHGIPTNFEQDNHSGSEQGVVRGLHFQWTPAMGKLMRVTRGSALLLAVDIRHGSPTLGEWIGIEATAENHRQVWAPAGFARGFAALTDFVDIQYKCTGIYNSAGESGIRWNDPEIGIEWPFTNPKLSAKDEAAQTLAEWLATKESQNFQY